MTSYLEKSKGKIFHLSSCNKLLAEKKNDLFSHEPGKAAGLGSFKNTLGRPGGLVG